MCTCTRESARCTKSLGCYRRDAYVTDFRFMMEPHKTMVNDLKNQEKELTEDINNLNKKVG